MKRRRFLLGSQQHQTPWWAVQFKGLYTIILTSSITFWLHCGQKKKKIQAFKRNLHRLWRCEIVNQKLNCSMCEFYVVNSVYDLEYMNRDFFFFPSSPEFPAFYFLSFFFHFHFIFQVPHTLNKEKKITFRWMCEGPFYVSCVFVGQCIKKQCFPFNRGSRVLIAVLSGSVAHGWSWTSKTSLTAFYNPAAWLRRQTAVAIIWDYLLCSGKKINKKTIRGKKILFATQITHIKFYCVAQPTPQQMHAAR